MVSRQETISPPATRMLLVFYKTSKMTLRHGLELARGVGHLTPTGLLAETYCNMSPCQITACRAGRPARASTRFRRSGSAQTPVARCRHCRDHTAPLPLNRHPAPILHELHARENQHGIRPRTCEGVGDHSKCIGRRLPSKFYSYHQSPNMLTVSITKRQNMLKNCTFIVFLPP